MRSIETVGAAADGGFGLNAAAYALRVPRLPPTSRDFVAIHFPRRFATREEKTR